MAKLAFGHHTLGDYMRRELTLVLDARTEILPEDLICGYTES